MTVRLRLAGPLSFLLVLLELVLPAGADDRPAISGGETAADVKWMILIDAGSSGSRMHVYSYTWAGGDSYPVFQLPDKKLKTKPGLSSFKDNPTAAGASLEQLVEFAKKTIPAASHAGTSILVSATAGLRAMPAEKASAILDNCFAWLKKHTPFKVQRKGIALLSGKDEGALGWLSLNFLGRRLAGMANEKQGTLAGVEMGGASAQVTFERALPHNADGALQEDESDTAYELPLGSRKTSLYTHSYLNYGQEAAREQVSKRLASDSDPCLLKGFSRTGTPPPGASVYEGRSTGAVTGTGDFAKCRSEVDEIFKEGGGCSVPPCSFGGVHQPGVFEKGLSFVAWENFFHTARGAGVEGVDVGVTVKRLEAAGEKQCGKSHTAADMTNDSMKLCFSLAFLSSFLHAGLKVPVEKDFKILSAIDGNDIEWVLGQAITHAMAPKSGAQPRQPDVPEPFTRGVHLAVWGWAAAFAGIIVVVGMVRSASNWGKVRDNSGGEKDAADEMELGLLDEESMSKILGGGQTAWNGARGVEVRKR